MQNIYIDKHNPISNGTGFQTAERHINQLRYVDNTALIM